MGTRVFFYWSRDYVSQAEIDYQGEANETAGQVDAPTGRLPFLLFLLLWSIHATDYLN